MYRTDAEATRQSITRRPARNGDEVDAFAASRGLDSYRSGQRAAIKARASRSHRADVRVQLSRYTTI
jgi:hypothetical protein